MRPVNLIPPEERKGSRKRMRGGPVAYIVIGTLLAALGGVTLLVIAGNQISDRTSEIARLEAQTATAEAEAARLAPYAQFDQIRDQRTTTISNLADSRFDWERVIRELALVFPSDVRLTNLTGTVRPDVTVNNGEHILLRESIAGPALQMVGCAAGQEAVARFVTVLKDLDGVTRTGVQSSEQPNGGGGSGSVSASGGCEGALSTQFQLVVAFDAAPIPAAATGSAVSASSSEEGGEPSSTEPDPATESEGG